MRKIIAIGLLLFGLFVGGLSLETDLCRINGDDGDRYFAAVLGGSLLIGCSAFLFARRPTWPPVASYAMGVIAMPAAFVAFWFLGALAWASTCAN